MKKEFTVATQKNQEILIGAFILAGVIIVSGMIIMGGSTSFFSSTYKVVVDIAHVGDLRVGAPLKLGGFPIGRVTDITLGQRNLEIELDVDANRKLPNDCTAHITTAGLVGDAFLEIKLGTSKVFLKQVTAAKEADRIKGQGPIDYNELLGQVKVIGTEITSIVGHVNDLIGNPDVKKDIRETIANLNATSIEAKRFLISLRKSSDYIQTAAKDVSDTVKRVKEMSGTIKNTVDKTIGDEKNVEKINAMLANAEAITKTLKNTLEEQEKNIKSAIADAKSIIGDVKKITSEMGPDKGVMPLFTSDKYKDDINKVVDYLKNFISNQGIITALEMNRYADAIATDRLKEWKRAGVRNSDELKKKAVEQIRKDFASATNKEELGSKIIDKNEELNY